MKRKIQYTVDKKVVEREIQYIPVRYIFAVLITVLEVAAIIGIVVALCYYVPYFYIAAWLTEIACVIKIVASDDSPEYKVPWLLFVLILPIAGFMLYFIFYSRKLQKKYVRRLKALKEKSYLKNDDKEFSGLKAQNLQAYGQAKLLCKISDSHLFMNTKHEYFSIGEDMWKRLLADLENAERFIYMEYFIIEEGKFWNSILEILKRKAAQGLDVRVVYDDIGCMSTLPGNYAKILGGFGIKATPFSRLKGNADSEFNNRSHRKITVIDGRVGYTGGINIADEYVNEVVRFGHWKDVGLRLEGDAVWEMTKLFLIDFGINVKEDPAFLPYVELYPKTDGEANGFSVPFGDGPKPLYERRVGKSIIRNMIDDATEYVWIATPYLIVDNDLCQSLENAAIRGVDVRLITPHIPDKKIVFEITRSFYPRLMKAGVKIYEYESGFVHAKTYLVDGKIAMVGTINLDYRSLVHHFENGVWMYKTDCIADIRLDMEDTLEKSILITPEKTKTNLLQQFIRAVVRIFAPML